MSKLTTEKIDQEEELLQRATESSEENDAYRKEIEEHVADIKESAAFDLDAALDSYDPTFPNYTPSERAFEFFTLMSMVNGGDQEFPSPIAHYFMVDLLLNEITDPMVFPYSEEVCKTIEIDHLRIAFMASRGIAKSTVVISFFGVYSAIKGELPNGIGKVWFYLVLAASSRGGARVNALAVKAMCEDSVFLKDYFESMRFTEFESEFVRKGTGPVKNRSFLIRYQGANTGVRGIRYGERRICAIIGDDMILNEKYAYSKTIKSNLESILHTDAVAALKGGGKGRILITFTPFHVADVNTSLVMDGAYTPCVIPLSTKIDADKDNLSTKDIKSTWESMHPATSILSMIKGAIKSNKLKSFLQERMLRLTSSEEKLIKDSWIKWYKRSDILDNLSEYNLYMTTDLTTTGGPTADLSGIATWAVNSNSDFFLLDISLSQKELPEQYDEIFRQANQWGRLNTRRPTIGIETDGQQDAHIYTLEEQMIKRNEWITIGSAKGSPKGTKGIKSRKVGGTKHWRFRMTVPLWQNGKIWIPLELKDTPDIVELLEEIKMAKQAVFASKYDDGADLVSMLVPMDIHYPSPTVSSEYKMSKIGHQTWGIYLWGDKQNEVTGHAGY